MNPFGGKRERQRWQGEEGGRKLSKKVSLVRVVLFVLFGDLLFSLEISSPD